MPNHELFRAKVPGLMKRFMADFDCTVEDAAAVFGNAGHESGGFRLMQELKPTIAGSRGGYGWFQWTGPRRRAFEDYCRRNKLVPSSDEANYKFLWVELHGDEAGALPKLKAAKGLSAKVIAFEQGFERAGVKHYPSRQEYARIAMAAYDLVKGRLPDTPPFKVPPIKTNSPAKPAGWWVGITGWLPWKKV
jgi:hypothetical protein